MVNDIVGLLNRLLHSMKKDSSKTRLHIFLPASDSLDNYIVGKPLRVLKTEKRGEYVLVEAVLAEES